MKQKFLIAAGLLCLGTGPAFAFTIPAMAPDMAKAVKEVWTDQMAAEQPSIFDTGEAWMGETKTPKAASAGAPIRSTIFWPRNRDYAPAKISICR